jgi:flavin-dependent dehydrogenase
MLAGRLGLREMDGELKNFAVFSHFEGAERHSGDREGDITVVLSPEGWWWVIPLVDDRTSVGMVAPARFLKGRKPDESYFAEQIERCPYLRKRFESARRVAPVRTISDYSYTSKKIAGKRWLLVGDAAAFIDPVFSTGVCLGMLGAFKAADAVDLALSNGGSAGFAAYERWVKATVGQYRRFVKGFYTPEFVEVLMHPSDRLELRRAVISLLAGLAPGRLDILWRTLCFQGIARVNRHFKLTPRLDERREAQSGNSSSDR